MTFDPNYLTYIPQPYSDSGLKGRLDYEAVLSPAPNHIVTHKSQLPKEFLVPSPESQLVIGFECEGVGLSRCGTLCIMQIAFPNAIYLVDAIKGGKKVMRACEPALESSYITKVIHDCKRDSEAGANTTSALTKLTTRLNFLKERRTQITNELQNFDNGRGSANLTLNLQMQKC